MLKAVLVDDLQPAHLEIAVRSLRAGQVRLDRIDLIGAELHTVQPTGLFAGVFQKGRRVYRRFAVLAVANEFREQDLVAFGMLH